MSNTGSKNPGTSLNQNEQRYSQKSLDSDHILFTGLAEHSDPSNNLRSHCSSEMPDITRNEVSNFVSSSDSASQQQDHMYDTLDYSVEDVFTNVFGRLGNRFLKDSSTSYYSASSNSSMLNHNVEHLNSKERLDGINEPISSINRSCTFRPLKSQLGTFGSSAIFPNFKTFRTNTGDFFLSHNQDFEDYGDSYVIKTEFPGYSKGDISVNVNGKYLEIVAMAKSNGENVQGNLRTCSRSAMSYSSTLTIPPGVISNSITARYRDGILTVKLPKDTTAIGEY
ncbi:hypothetical protein BMR1_01G01515 [Babesia microti strain RI]|uniref:SHSP domain-containing protein n=1 Tax=Babesia microti (strain RI) TaxID=1133968 RepID=I7J8A7_BABMR|nr:hypothetical protein BMR1_01G01515 [Babesia microti strain RI]CCF72764.1 hypothetical protein BMR1_01G01515 [Babesia microti strain RI]|eukprot:XP_012647373.1 hypothetical protein BMR1_01G01515 [Babesia microti strain RI]